MLQTYQEAMQQVYSDEGGYTNEATDPGGPTNWGITIYDARKYWKPSATAKDVKNMPKDVAAQIYRLHYANAIHYDDLPPGVDYAVLDFGINSGISRSARYLQRIVGAVPDGVIGPNTILNVNKMNPVDIINKLYDARLAYLQSLTRMWRIYGHGWTLRCDRGRKLAIYLYNKYKTKEKVV